MRGTMLLVTLVVVSTFTPVHAQSVNVGVQTGNMAFGINIGPQPPPLVVVPAPVIVAPGPPPPPVYYAPNLPYNYFVYQNVYYVYHGAHWYRAKHYNGPWTGVAIAQVPRPILAVPAERYHPRPAHWEQHGPPPWAHEKAKEKHHGKNGNGHEKHKGHD